MHCCEWACLFLISICLTKVCVHVCVSRLAPAAAAAAVGEHEQQSTCMNWFIAFSNNHWSLWDCAAHVKQEFFAEWATQMNCWIFWLYLEGKGSRDWWSNFTALWWSISSANFFWMETGLYHRMTVNHLVDEIYFKSLAVNDLISQYFFLYLPTCSKLSDKRDGLFCLSWLSISPAL